MYYGIKFYPKDNMIIFTVFIRTFEKLSRYISEYLSLH